jgi:hypothetical protein
MVGDRQTGSKSALLTLTLETSMVTDTFDSSLEESLRVSLLIAKISSRMVGTGKQAQAQAQWSPSRSDR